MKQTIFHLENRGAMYMYHFIFFNLAGLYYIENKLYNVKGKDYHPNGSTFPILNKVVSEPSQEITYPIKIHMNTRSCPQDTDETKTFWGEAFEIIKDRFILIEDLNSLHDYEVVNIYGGLWNKDLNLIAPYIRDLFTSRVTSNSEKKNIFITRNNSDQFHNGELKRYMRNEMDFVNNFKKNDLQYVVLEYLSFKEKIQLFMNARTIISSHSGGLSFTAVCNKDANIIEILNRGTPNFNHCHYKDIASVLNLTNYKRYTNISEDSKGNFDLNINEFKHYLLENKIIIYI